MNKKPIVTIGIPAYNEAANIKRLLRALLLQTQKTFVLKEIIVVSDGSSDTTVKEVRSIADDRITLVDHTDRKGAAARQNEIIDLFKGDVLILLNADILPKSPNYIANFVKPFLTNPRLGLASGQGVPAPSRSLFESVLNFSVVMKSEMIAEWNGGDNILACRGHSRAFSKAFAKKFRWAGVVAEDAYSYLENKMLGYEFQSVKDVVITYRSPASMRDHLKQSSRFYGSRKELIEGFPNLPVAQYYAMPKMIFVQKVLKYFFINPIYFILYICIQLRVKLHNPNNQNALAWEPATSSKSI